MATPGFLTEYELAREKLMQRNAQKMAELGIFVASRSLAAAASPPPRVHPTKQPSRRQAGPADVTPARSSSRVRNKPAPVYVLPESFEEEERAEKRARARKGTGVSYNRSPWDNTSWPPHADACAAAEAAAKTMNALDNPSFCKIMLPSMVAGGFWMEAPQGLPAHMPHGAIASKHPFFLVRHPDVPHSERENVDGEDPPESLSPSDPADEWRVVWLVRKGDGKISGGGFSGGWRGFAIDLKLAVGDAVVFEVLPGRRNGMLAVQARVHRARDPGSIRPSSEMLPSAGDNDEPAGEDYGYTTAAIESRGGGKRRKISEAELLLREAGSIFASGADQGAATDEEEEEEEGGKEAKAHGEKVKKALVGAKLATPSAGGGDTGRALVGRRVGKVFEGEMYGGTVAAFDAKVRWYRVDYDDGDVEEVSISELRAILLQ